MTHAVYSDRTQYQIYDETVRGIAVRDEVALDLLFGTNPLTDDELRTLVAKYPQRWERYAGYIGKR